MIDLNSVEILLVEDNPQDAELILRAFKKHNLANALFHVEDGAEALDFLFSRGTYKEREGVAFPKLVLLDLKLPKVNGLEVLRAIKTDERMRAIPVVILTSSLEYPDIKTAYELWANSYVVKPVAFDAFLSTMNTLGLFWLSVNHPLK